MFHHNNKLKVAIFTLNDKKIFTKDLSLNNLIILSTEGKTVTK